jgi:23S rRNA (adenine2030-N6)-methyltransferase
MNYRHIFHAGNFADVFKHALLALLVQALTRKDAPFCYLDTHAGIGRYDLHHPSAAKTGEFRLGIGRLWEEGEPPLELAPYLDAVRALNGDARLRFYPGSPRIARHFLRPHDRMVLLERHPDEVEVLKNEFAGDRQVVVHCQDGYAGLKAFLPPKERRGLVLIDPPYEARDELDQVIAGLKVGYERWPGGTFAVWYPVKDRASIERFRRRLVATGIRKMLDAELIIHPTDTAFRLNGCGLVVINPPWQLDAAFERLLPALLARLRQDGPGAAGVSWLVPE